MLRLIFEDKGHDGTVYWIELEPTINPHTQKIKDIGPAELYNSKGWVGTDRRLENLVRVAYTRIKEDRHQPQLEEDYAEENVPRLPKVEDAPDVPEKVRWKRRTGRNDDHRKLRLGKLLSPEVATKRDEGGERSPKVDGGGGGDWNADTLFD